jgi:acyl carrier protein
MYKSMDSITIIAEIKKYIQNNILAENIQLDATTDLKQAGIDSFSTVEIILFIERKFGVAIPDEKLIPENFKTLQSLAATVLELVPEAT